MASGGQFEFSDLYFLKTAILTYHKHFLVFVNEPGKWVRDGVGLVGDDAATGIELVTHFLVVRESNDFQLWSILRKFAGERASILGDNEE